MKEWLKSVLNYRSYPQIKLGIRIFGPPCTLSSAAGPLSKCLDPPLFSDVIIVKIIRRPLRRWQQTKRHEKL